MTCSVVVDVDIYMYLHDMGFKVTLLLDVTYLKVVFTCCDLE